MSNLDLYRYEKDRIRENLNRYTAKAFKMINRSENLLILDIGCGTGVPTLELAKLSGGTVVGVDIDQCSLDILQKKADDLGLNHSIRTIKKSIFFLEFPEESFDIIWSEGAVSVLGFEESIKSWYSFLKPKGFLILHDEATEKDKKVNSIKKWKYKLIGQFDLSPDLWWLEYFIPLENLVGEFRDKYSDDPELTKELDSDQEEIEKCRSNPSINSSFFIILQKS